MVGPTLVRRLQQEPDVEVLAPKRSDLNLFERAAVGNFTRVNQPNTVVLAAVKVGRIAANIASPVAFLRESLSIQDHVMISAAKRGVQNIIFLGASCVYPRECPQSMRESDYVTGTLEPTNES